MPEPENSPAAGPRAMPSAAVHVAAACTIGAVLWLLYGGGYVSLDAMWSLVWGRDVAALEPLASSATTTPHVLSNLIGALLSPLGADADRALVVIEFLAAGTLVWCVALLARELSGTAAGVLAGVVIATREQLLYATTSTFLDVIVAALVAWAALLAVRWIAAAADPDGEGAAPGRNDGAPARGLRTPWAALTLLTLAGLLRPEPWVVAGALWAYAAWRSRAALLSALALVAAAPLSWLAFDAAFTGDALNSVHVTNGINDVVRTGQRIPDTTVEHLVSIPRNLVHAAGPELIVAAGIVAVLLVLGRRPGGLGVRLAAGQRPAVALLVAGYVVYAAVIAAEALAGSLIFARFALAPTGLLVALVAGLLVSALGLGPSSSDARSDGAAEPRRVLRPALAAVAGLVVVVQLPFLVHAREVTGREHDRYDVARAAITPGVPCAPVAVPGANFRAYAAVWADVRGREVVDAATSPLPRRSTMIDAEGAEPLALLHDPSFRQRSGFPASARVRIVDGWTISTTCPVGG